MTCDHARDLIAASWLRELSDADERELRGHTAGCAVCRAEMDSLGAMWDRLGDLPAPEPGRELDSRWRATLDGFAPARKGWGFWPQAGLAFAALAIGVGIGMGIGALLPKREAGEIARLRSEVETTRAMVALSLMQQESATQRLRGVDYSGQLPRLDPQVTQALIDAVNHDANTNVRLAAIDALGRVSGSQTVLRSMAQSLPAQDSPMVQSALIDYLVDARDRTALGTLRDFERMPNLAPAVIERADAALKELNK